MIGTQEARRMEPQKTKKDAKMLRMPCSTAFKRLCLRVSQPRAAGLHVLSLSFVSFGYRDFGRGRRPRQARLIREPFLARLLPQSTRQGCRRVYDAPLPVRVKPCLIPQCLPATLLSQYVVSEELVVPEMPEVENIALGLRPVLVGKRVASVWVGSPIIVRGPDRRRWRAFMAELTGRRITSVSRRAKRLGLTAEGRLALVVPTWYDRQVPPAESARRAPRRHGRSIHD